jgi:tetratricopeptide (TPR) repeat protein
MSPAVARALRLAAAVALATGPAPAAAADPLAQGDAAWARRAEGHDGAGRAAPGPIAEAITAYEAAVAAAPDAVAPRWKLLRALHFAADFAARDRGEERALVDRATAAAEVARPLLARGGAPPRDAAALHFWAAIAWGAWAQRHGLLGAVREGVMNRVHRDVEAAIALDAAIEDGGALRLLARLHATLPRIPLLSGWVDRDQALPAMERALAVAPDHLGNRVLFGLTLLDVAPARRAEALAALAAAAVAEPDGEAVVEALAIRRTARERLAAERARGERG